MKFQGFFSCKILVSLQGCVYVLIRKLLTAHFTVGWENYCMQGVKGHVQNGTGAVAVSGYWGSVGLESRSVYQEKTGNCFSGLWKLNFSKLSSLLWRTKPKQSYVWATISLSLSILCFSYICGNLYGSQVLLGLSCKGRCECSRAAESQWLPTNWDCSISKDGRVTQGMDTFSTHQEVLKHVAMFSGTFV